MGIIDPCLATKTTRIAPNHEIHNTARTVNIASIASNRGIHIILPTESPMDSTAWPVGKAISAILETEDSSHNMEGTTIPIKAVGMMTCGDV